MASNDTDSLVLLIHFFKLFRDLGLAKLWIRVGTSKNKRLIPVYSLYTRLPGPLRKVLLAAYIGTGCDYIWWRVAW